MRKYYLNLHLIAKHQNEGGNGGNNGGNVGGNGGIGGNGGNDGGIGGNGSNGGNVGGNNQVVEKSDASTQIKMQSTKIIFKDPRSLRIRQIKFDKKSITIRRYS